jgi:type IV fimbrial biogenesis protein FimT
MRIVKTVKGFTVVELAVTIAVMSILLALAIPSFQSVLNSNRLTSNANEMVSTLQSARMESVRRNVNVVICRNDDPDAGLACNTGGGAWLGWMSFVDDGAGGGTARDGTPNGTEVVLYSGTLPVSAQVFSSPAISGGNQRINFRPDGLAYSDGGLLLNAQFAVCIPTTAPPMNVRLVSIGSGSRIGVARANGGGACAAPANT